MVTFCLVVLPGILFWRQWAIISKRWKNIIIPTYIWFAAGTNLISIQDHYAPYYYFRFKTPGCFAFYLFLWIWVGVLSILIYWIAFWKASHTYWRHLLHSWLLYVNKYIYSNYSADYQVDFFNRWFRRQKKFKFTKSIILHHSIFYLLFVLFVLFYEAAPSWRWYELSQWLHNGYYIWFIFIYLMTLFRSLFMANFLFGHMYFYANNIFFEGISDTHYFINDDTYSRRLRPETMPMTESGFRQVGKCFNSKRRMYRVEKYYLLDRNLEHGRFFMPVTWINFKHETYDFISTTIFYRVKSRFQRFWFQAAVNLAFLRRVRLKKTFYVRKRRKYRATFFLKKKL